MMSSSSSQTIPAQKMPGHQFVALIAAMTSMVALALDTMLPALPYIGQDLGIANPNHNQYIIAAMFVGLGLGQLAFGPISDSTGRRPAIVVGFVIFILGSILTTFATSFNIMMVGRVLQGLGAAGPRIVSIAVVRDLYAGRAMAKVMSLAMTLFILVPVFAPALGGIALLYGSWRWIFGGILIISVLIFAWFLVGLPESLPPEKRVPFSLRHVALALKEVACNRIALGYTVAGGLLFGALVGYLASSEQIFAQAYHLGLWYPVVFGCMALCIGASSILNSKLVMKYGMRYLAWRATLVFCATSVVFVLVSLTTGGLPPLWLLVTILCISFSCLGLLFSNYGALAMEYVGHIAGVAAAFNGCVSVFVSAILGGLIGQAYDGTVLPISLGYCVLGFGALGMMAWTEHGRAPAPRPA